MLALMILASCSAYVNVQTTHPEARVGVTEGYPPSAGNLASLVQGKGSASGRVSYWAGSEYWAWALPEGADTPSVVRIPNEGKGGAIAGCAIGILVWPALASCFFVSGPTERTVTVQLPE